MSIASEITRLQGAKANIKASINAKGGTLTDETLTDYAAAIDAIATGSGIVPAIPKDVNFYDYDGTCVYSYTLAEVAELSALPALPDHTGDTIPLTGQEWNYTLAQVNALTRKANVGATYITTDGKTHLTIKILNTARMVVPLYWTQTVANGVTINWGDGTSEQTFTGTGNKSTTHTYSAVGTYDITLDVAIGCEIGLGNNSVSYCVLGNTVIRIYCNMLKYVKIGLRVAFTNYEFPYCAGLETVAIPISVTSIGDFAFYGCYSLEFVTIPSGVTIIGTKAFNGCYRLKIVAIPIGVTSVGDSSLQYCYFLESVTIPSGVETIIDVSFYNCTSLPLLTIPDSVTSIGNNAFYGCNGVKDFYIYPTTPPTLGGTAAFDNIASDAVIHVPTASETAYKEATNWAEYAAKIVGDL